MTLFVSSFVLWYGRGCGGRDDGYQEVVVTIEIDTDKMDESCVGVVDSRRMVYGINRICRGRIWRGDNTMGGRSESESGAREKQLTEWIDWESESSRKNLGQLHPGHPRGTYSMLRPPKLYTISIPSNLLQRYVRTYGLLNRSVRRHYWCLRLRVGESRCNIVDVSNQESSITLALSTSGFSASELLRAYHF
jgi:hypothetical protein